MRNILILVYLIFFCFLNVNASEWKFKNKWKISCGIVDKESLVVNGKPKTIYNKKEFKLESVVFKLDKGDIGSCSTDKKPSGGYPYSGRQEISHKLDEGQTVFETDLLIEGAPSARSTIFQIHDGRTSDAPPSWIGVGRNWQGRDWKIIHAFPKNDCSSKNCKMIKDGLFLKPGKQYRLKAELNYERKAKKISARYYLNDVFILQHLEVPLSKKKTDGPYGKSKPYIKIGIYRIGDTGTTTFSYSNLTIKNKKK